MPSSGLLGHFMNMPHSYTCRQSHNHRKVTLKKLRKQKWISVRVGVAMLNPCIDQRDAQSSPFDGFSRGFEGPGREL